MEVLFLNIIRLCFASCHVITNRNGSSIESHHFACFLDATDMLIIILRRIWLKFVVKEERMDVETSPYRSPRCPVCCQRPLASSFMRGQSCSPRRQLNHCAASCCRKWMYRGQNIFVVKNQWSTPRDLFPREIIISQKTSRRLTLDRKIFFCVLLDELNDLVYVSRMILAPKNEQSAIPFSRILKTYIA